MADGPFIEKDSPDAAVGPVSRKRARVRKSKGEKRKIKLLESIKCGSIRRLVVLDLNGVLIHRNKVTSSVVLRPHAISLLNYLSERCAVALWTSSKKTTVKRLFRTLFTAGSGFCHSRFLFVWCQNRCSQEPAAADIGTAEGAKPLMQGAKPLFWKEISLIWSEYPDFAFESGCYLVDDSLQKLERNPVTSRIHVPTYMGPDSNGIDTDEVMKPGGDLYETLTRLTEQAPCRADTDTVSEMLYANVVEKI